MARRPPGAAPAAMAPTVSDLVLDSKIETDLALADRGLTRHVRTALGRSARHRQLRTEETWQRRRPLGSGTYGVVWLERCVEGKDKDCVRAVKEIRKDTNLPASFWHRELEAIAKFSHDRYAHCFVRSSGWFESESSVFIAMEYLKHGDLQRYLNRPFPEAEARQITLQLVEGLELMHRNGFAHRDLKPQNIMIFRPGPSWWVKIGDFGISKRVHGSALRTFEVGTQGYMAPELHHIYCPDEPEATSEFIYTAAVDMWALGEIAYRMITKQPSFPEGRQLFNYVVMKKAFPTGALDICKCTPDCRDFIQRCMAASPRRRLVAKDALEHTWIQSHQYIDDAGYTSDASDRSDVALPEPAVDEASAQWTNLPLEPTKQSPPLVSPLPQAFAPADGSKGQSLPPSASLLADSLEWTAPGGGQMTLTGNRGNPEPLDAAAAQWSTASSATAFQQDGSMRPRPAQGLNTFRPPPAPPATVFQQDGSMWNRPVQGHGTFRPPPAPPATTFQQDGSMRNRPVQDLNTFRPPPLPPAPAFDFTVLNAYDQNWRQTIGEDLMRQGFTEEMLHQNQELVVALLASKKLQMGTQPQRAAPPPPGVPANPPFTNAVPTAGQMFPSANSVDVPPPPQNGQVETDPYRKTRSKPPTPAKAEDGSGAGSGYVDPRNRLTYPERVNPTVPTVATVRSVRQEWHTPNPPRQSAVQEYDNSTVQTQTKTDGNSRPTIYSGGRELGWPALHPGLVQKTRKGRLRCGLPNCASKKTFAVERSLRHHLVNAHGMDDLLVMRLPIETRAEKQSAPTQTRAEKQPTPKRLICHVPGCTSNKTFASDLSLDSHVRNAHKSGNALPRNSPLGQFTFTCGHPGCAYLNKRFATSLELQIHWDNVHGGGAPKRLAPSPAALPPSGRRVPASRGSVTSWIFGRSSRRKDAR